MVAYGPCHWPLLASNSAFIRVYSNSLDMGTPGNCSSALARSAASSACASSASTAATSSGTAALALPAGLAWASGSSGAPKAGGATGAAAGGAPVHADNRAGNRPDRVTMTNAFLKAIPE